MNEIASHSGPKRPILLRCHAGLLGPAVLLHLVAGLLPPGPGEVAHWPVDVLGFPWRELLLTFVDPGVGWFLPGVLAVAPAVINLLIHGLWQYAPVGAPRRGSTTSSVLVLGLATAACWAVWMGWDRSYDHDPVTGEVSGLIRSGRSSAACCASSGLPFSRPGGCGPASWCSRWPACSRWPGRSPPPPPR